MRQWVEAAIAARQEGRLDDAVALLRDAAEASPASPIPRLELGRTLALQNLPDDAVAELEKAYALAPPSPEFIEELARLAVDIRRAEAAVRFLRRAIERESTSPRLYSRLRQAYWELGDLKNGNAAGRESVRLGALPGEHSNLILGMHYDDSDAPELGYAEARRWAMRHTSASAPAVVPINRDRTPGRKLRIGYLSPDLRDQPVGRLLHPVLKHHDRRRFEPVIFHDARKDDIVTRQMRALAGEWHVVRDFGDAQLVDYVRRQRVDILVEMSGHFGGNRLLALSQRMAPIQVSGFGYFATTGVPAIDYRFTDPFATPDESYDELYTERLVRLPHCSWCYRPFEPMPEVGPLPAMANGYITFGSLNNPVKTSDSCLETWAALLRAVPGSRLIALCGENAEPRFRRTFAGFDIEGDRLELVRQMTRHNYLKTFRRIDIALDPFPFNGDNTTFDAMWMGVPVVALAGNTFASRRGLSHLTNVGHPEWCGTDREAYARIASGLAGDITALSGLRQRLRGEFDRSVLADAQGYTVSIETAYRQMWSCWLNASDLT